MNPQSLVIGFGSTLRGDDALGRIAAERVRQAVTSNDVRVIQRYSPTPDLAAELCEVSRAVFLDASVEGASDQVVTFRLDENSSAETLGHRFEMGALLSLTRHLYGRAPEAFAITFRGKDFEFRDRSLSPAAETALDQIVENTLRLIG